MKNEEKTQKVLNKKYSLNNILIQPNQPVILFLPEREIYQEKVEVEDLFFKLIYHRS